MHHRIADQHQYFIMHQGAAMWICMELIMKACDGQNRFFGNARFVF